MLLLRCLSLALVLSIFTHAPWAQIYPPHPIQVASLTSPEADFPPYAWIDQNTGNENGIAKYVLEKILLENNRRTRWHSADIANSVVFSAMMAQIAKGEIDMISSVYKPYPQPSYLYFPKVPAYELEVRIYVNRQRSFDYKNIYSLQDKRGAAIQYFDASIIDDPEFTKIAAESLNIRGVNNIVEIFSLLLDGEIDYAILPKITTESLLHYYKIKNQIKRLSHVFATVPVYYVFSAKSKALALEPAFNQYLKELDQSGELRFLEQRFMQEYINYRNSQPEINLNKTLKH